MKLFRTILLCLLMGCAHSPAQGTLEFTFTLDGNHAVPPQCQPLARHWDFHILARALVSRGRFR